MLKNQYDAPKTEVIFLCLEDCVLTYTSGENMDSKVGTW